MEKLSLRILLICILTFFISCDNREELGNELIQKIEDYRIKNKKLPESLADIGVEEKEEGPLYYSKDSETDYIIWYGLTLGESRIYDSKTKVWD